MSREQVSYLQHIFDENKNGVTFINIGTQIIYIVKEYDCVKINYRIPISQFDSITFDVALILHNEPCYLFNIVDDFRITNTEKLKIIYPSAKIFEISADWLLCTKTQLGETTRTVNVVREL